MNAPVAANPETAPDAVALGDHATHEAHVRLRSRMRRDLQLLLSALVAATALFEGSAILLVLRASHAGHALFALVLHFAAAATAVWSAAVRRRGRLRGVYFDLVLLLALAIPAFGPLIAWMIPSKRIHEQGVNAHELFERYEEHVRHSEAPYKRTLFTGDFDRDMARELDVESYYDVLAAGDIHQKRSALSKLVSLGAPHHLALVRKSLRDPDQEVQLYAYGQIAALEERYEDAIDEFDDGTEEGPRDPEIAVQLAAAHLAYAHSGVLDAVLGAHHCELAAEFAARGRSGPAPSEAMRIELRARLGMGDTEHAQSIVDELLALDAQDSEARRILVEFAYAARDFERAREEIRILQAREPELAPWMRALLEARPHAPEPVLEEASA